MQNLGRTRPCPSLRLKLTLAFAAAMALELASTPCTFNSGRSRLIALARLPPPQPTSSTRPERTVERSSSA